MSARRLILTDAAEEEILEAARWYEREAAGLGKAFLEQVERTLEAIAENPRRFAAIYRRETRRAILRRFPYAVFFRERTDGAL